MYDIYFWTTPNGFKILLLAEEAGLAYTLRPVNISRGEQFQPSFLAISLNNRIPALVDNAPAGGGEPVSIFESGAILLYLAEKIGRYIPADIRGRAEVLQWLFWQMGGLGPMAGQNNHFRSYAPEKIAYAVDRYTREVNRLYGVMDRRLTDRAFLAGDDYTIADMAAYPWLSSPERHGQNIDDFPHLKRWRAAIAGRPATVRAYEKGRAINAVPTVGDEQSRKLLFGQTAAVLGGQLKPANA
jgi:GST-like protein